MDPVNDYKAGLFAMAAPESQLWDQLVELRAENGRLRLALALIQYRAPSKPKGRKKTRDDPETFLRKHELAKKAMLKAGMSPKTDADVARYVQKVMETASQRRWTTVKRAQEVKTYQNQLSAARRPRKASQNS